MICRRRLIGHSNMSLRLFPRRTNGSQLQKRMLCGLARLVRDSRDGDITTKLVVLPVSCPTQIHDVPQALEEDKELKPFIVQIHGDQIKAGYNMVNSSYFFHIAVSGKSM